MEQQSPLLPVVFANFKGVISPQDRWEGSIPPEYLSFLQGANVRYGRVDPIAPSTVLPVPANYSATGALLMRANLPKVGNALFLAYYDSVAQQWKLARWRPGETQWTILGNLPGRVTSYAIYQGHLFLATTGGMRKTEGTAVYNWGIAPPTQAPSTQVGTTGNLSGTYQYAVTFVRSDFNGTYIVESNPSPPSAPLTVSQKQITVTIPTSSDPQVTARRIYRYGGTRTTWDLVTTINDNTSTSWTDNTPDSALVGAPTLSYANDPPPQATVVAAYRERLWIAGNPNNPSRLYFSTFGAPEYFPAVTPNDIWGGSWMDVGAQDTAAGITGIASVGTMLAIFKPNGTWLLRGENQSDFILQPYGKIGASGPLLVTSVEGIVYHTDGQHLYRFDGTQWQNLSVGKFSNGARINKWQQLAVDAFNRYLLAVDDQGNLHVYDLALEEYIGMWVTGTVNTLAAPIGGDWPVLYFISQNNLFSLDPTQVGTGTVVFSTAQVPSEYQWRKASVQVIFIGSTPNFQLTQYTLVSDEGSRSVTFSPAKQGDFVATVPPRLLGQRWGLQTVAFQNGSLWAVQMFLEPLYREGAL